MIQKSSEAVPGDSELKVNIFWRYP